MSKASEIDAEVDAFKSRLVEKLQPQQVSRTATGDLDDAREMLQHLNLQMKHALGERDRRIAEARAYWDAKPRTMLNDRLKRIALEAHYARSTLETADIQAQREQIIDALSQIEMTK